MSGKTMVQIFKSEIVYQNLNPEFKPFIIEVFI